MQYSKFVKPAFDDFILPTKKYADIIIPRGGDNHVAIDLIVQHIRTKLGQHDLCKIYPNLYVIQSTFQVLFPSCCYRYILVTFCFGFILPTICSSSSRSHFILLFKIKLLFSSKVDDLFHLDTWHAYTHP